MTRCFALRSALGDTQKAFGLRLGISQTHVSKIEGGVVEHSATLDLLMDAIAEKHGLHHLSGAAFAPDIPASAGSDVSPPQGGETVTTGRLRDMPSESPSDSWGVSSLPSLAAPGSACGEGFPGVAE